MYGYVSFRIPSLILTLMHICSGTILNWFSRPWLCYWMVHPLALLDEPLDDDLENDIIDFLARCQDKDGGYAGGPGQVTPTLKLFVLHISGLDTIFDFSICIDFLIKL